MTHEIKEYTIEDTKRFIEDKKTIFIQIYAEYLLKNHTKIDLKYKMCNNINFRDYIFNHKVRDYIFNHKESSMFLPLIQQDADYNNFLEAVCNDNTYNNFFNELRNNKTFQKAITENINHTIKTNADQQEIFPFFFLYILTSVSLHLTFFCPHSYMPLSVPHFILCCLDICLALFYLTINRKNYIRSSKKDNVLQYKYFLLKKFNLFCIKNI